MGLFDTITDSLKSALQQGGAAAKAELISSVLEKTNLGSLQGVVEKLQAGGFEDQVKSWLGQGSNLPITADQLKSVLGQEQIQQIAQHFGTPVEDALKLVAEHLPSAVDHASPAGTL